MIAHTLAILILSGSPSHAEGPKQAAQPAPSYTHGIAKGERGPCDDDISKTCMEVPRGGGKLMKCLIDHVERITPLLSEGCKNWLAGRIKAINDMTDVCADDIYKFCTRVTPGEGRVLACLRQNQSSIARGCQAAIKDLWYE